MKTLGKHYLNEVWLPKQEYDLEIERLDKRECYFNYFCWVVGVGVPAVISCVLF